MLSYRGRRFEDRKDGDFTSNIDEPQVSERWFGGGPRDDSDRHPTLKTRRLGRAEIGDGWCGLHVIGKNNRVQNHRLIRLTSH